MNAWNRNRSRPTIVTSQEKRPYDPQASTSHASTSNTQQQEARYEEYTFIEVDLNDWCEKAEREIGRVIQERLNPQKTPVFDPQETIFLNMTANEDGIETLSREHDVENINETSVSPETPGTSTDIEYDPEFPSYEGRRLLQRTPSSVEPTTVPSYKARPTAPLAYDSILPETPPPSACYVPHATPFSFAFEDVTSEEEGGIVSEAESVAAQYTANSEIGDPLTTTLPPFDCGIPAAGPRSILWYVRDVCKFFQGNKPAPLGQNSEFHQSRGRKDIMPTEWIPAGSPYWKECLRAMKDSPPGSKREITSLYDNVKIFLHKHRPSKNNGGCRIVGCRNYTNVVLLREAEEDMKEEDVTYRASLRVIDEEQHSMRTGRVPTEMIPWNSNYYSSLLQDATFPRKGSAWIHRRACDKMMVHFHLGQQGRSLFAVRNGVTVQLYPHF